MGQLPITQFDMDCMEVEQPQESTSPNYSLQEFSSLGDFVRSLRINQFRLGFLRYHDGSYIFDKFVEDEGPEFVKIEDDDLQFGVQFLNGPGY
jgi:hypothetical protein